MKTKILIIDDEVAILHALGIVLEQEGYSVEAITKYGDYLDNVKAPELPDLIILDILLSNEDGREVVQILKSNTKTRSIPVIMISALPNVKDMSLDAGADAFLAKPFDMDELLEAIERVCGPKETSAQGALD